MMCKTLVLFVVVGLVFGFDKDENLRELRRSTTTNFLHSLEKERDNLPSAANSEDIEAINDHLSTRKTLLSKKEHQPPQQQQVQLIYAESHWWDGVCTFVTVGLCCIVWFYMWNNRIDHAIIAFNYTQVVEEKQWWRGVTAVYSHFGIMHLAFNMMGVYNLQQLEFEVGIKEYCKYIFLLIVLTNCLKALIDYVLITRFHQERYRHAIAVGYSGVLFGMLAITAVRHPAAPYQIPMMGTIPFLYAPVALLFLTQLIVWRASFIAHAAGMIIGYLIGFKVFSWFHDILFFPSLIAATVAVLWSLNETTPIKIPLLNRLSESRAPSSTVVGGHVVLVSENSERRAARQAEDNAIAAVAAAARHPPASPPPQTEMTEFRAPSESLTTSSESKTKVFPGKGYSLQSSSFVGPGTTSGAKPTAPISSTSAGSESGTRPAGANTRRADKLRGNHPLVLRYAQQQQQQTISKSRRGASPSGKVAGGDVSISISNRNKTSEKEMSPDFQAKVQQLIDLGYTKQDAVPALQFSSGDIRGATAYLQGRGS